MIKMKKLIILITCLLTGVTIYAQQMPISENYFLDKYSLAPSYAGNYNNKYLFLGYRSDWTGVQGGPKTFRLSYNDSFMRNAGFGGKFVYDQAGIFKQMIMLGTYSYKAKVSEGNFILFGLSAGFYSNRLNLYEYYNDPTYSLDPSLVSSNLNSKLKFMSDVSIVYTVKGFDAGFLFSNINIGTAKYSQTQIRYKPLANYQFHASYEYKVSGDWDITPLMILRGGKYIQTQFEIASKFEYVKKVWASILYRDAGIWGVGIGGNINKLIKIGYNFNIASTVASRFYNNHEISLGINIFELSKPKREFVPPGPEVIPEKK
jgi:type IX secretion system PorP/SprF family membrane protein